MESDLLNMFKENATGGAINKIPYIIFITPHAKLSQIHRKFYTLVNQEKIGIF